ncbi:MAG: O-antigen ligase family protein [Candidatus Sumerlaeaceae bacterium]|nr:O-antigen ligase family protein [Candidatus Sumerlaeaceae bacterium]
MSDESSPAQQPPVGAANPYLARLRGDLGVALLAMLFLVLPLYRTGALEDSFITPKVALLLIFDFVLLLWVTAQAARGQVRNLLGGGVGVLLGLFFAASAATLLYAESPAMGRTALAYWAGLILLFFVCSAALRDSLDLVIIFSAGIVAATLTAAWAVYEDFTRGAGGALVARLPDWRGYLAAGLGNSGHIAGFIGLFLPAALMFFLSARRFRFDLFAAIGVMFAALVVTWSVGSTGSTLLSLAVWCVVVVRGRWWAEFHWTRLLWIVVAGLCVSAFYLFAVPGNPHYPSLWTEAFGSKRWEEGGATRVVIYLTTLHMIQQHPLLGIGFGNFQLGYVQQIVPAVIQNAHYVVYGGAFTNDAHNEYLHIWSEGGAISLAIFVAILSAVFGALRRQLKAATDTSNAIVLYAAGAGITMLLLDSFMTFPLRLPAHAAAFMFFLAVPGVVASAAAGTANAGRRTADLMWCGALVLVAVAALSIYGRRTAAEYCYKQGRTLAEVIGPRVSPQNSWPVAEARYAAFTTRLSEGRTSEALALFGKGVLERPADGPLKDSEESYKRALSWDPNYTNATSRYGAMLLMQGRLEEASEMLKRTLGGLQAPEVHERLGMAYYLAGRKTDAAREWQICFDRRPVQRDYLSGLLRAAGK